MQSRFIRNTVFIAALISSINIIGSTSNSIHNYKENIKPAFNSNYIEMDKNIIDKPTNDNTESDMNNTSEAVPSKIDASTLSNEKIAWWYKPNKTHATPEVNLKLNFNLADYDAHYVGDTSRQVLYLTFDEGYENGYTGKILDILKDNDVKAIFFVTLPYLKDNPDLIKRMVDEGHIVGNHTNHHPSMPTVCGTEEKFLSEFTDVENKYKEITGEEMLKYFRPPMGEYSQKSLAMTKNLGYKTVFWSFAYLDWDIHKQPEPAAAKEKILGGLHNGSIMLIHAVSKTNAEILDSVLKDAKSQGYVFELLP
ncbi:MAG: delta-lactam-biosynthetic de-N-acetylase [Clostridium sp.]